MGWDQVHDEAETLEHSISDRLLTAIAAKLGDPARDPHGDPIPSAELEVDEAEAVSLDRLPVGTKGRLVRILDADADLLGYLDSLGVALGDEIEVLDLEPFGGPLHGVDWRPQAQPRPPCRCGPRCGVAVMTPPVDQGSFVVEPTAVPSIPSPLELLLARGRMRALLAMLGPAFVASSPTSIPATSRPTSRAAPSSATCCSGSCSWPT